MSLPLKYLKAERPKQELDLDQKLADKETQTIPCGKPKVPEGYQDLLLEFTINCNLHHPRNLVDYAAEYFAALKDQKHTKIVYDLVCTEKEEKTDRDSTAFSEATTVTDSEFSKDEHEKIILTSAESDSVPILLN
ncbi:unnamed protein product [Ceutorhynchus assimilis]|uniref:RIIa domain-containing protein n=1 Tax=Ceutorhynchus assimilis TaxID=467358 RepID=A0A9N9QNR4_9CUCU|nr:unnamed protein product [Ceutorhynchus assimilis]